MLGVFTAAVLSLAWFAALNVVVSLAAWALATAFDARRFARRPDVLMAVRLMPAAASTLIVVGIFLPSQWRFEPRGIDETFGAGVYLLAAAGALLLLRSAYRMVSVAFAGWQLRACTALPRVAPQVAGDSAVVGQPFMDCRVYEVPGLMGVSLAGVVRPRILVGPAVRQTLTAEELDAAVAHEMAHHTARDNMKRFVMLCAPDFFGQSAAARAIEDQWRAAAEWQADARAVRGDEARAVNLASALVKVARIAALAPARLTSPAWSTLHEAPLLETRVRRLVGGSAPPATAPRSMWIGVALACAAVVVAAAAAGAEVHRFAEAVVHLLP